MSSDYHFRPALVLRFMGACLAALGLLLLGVAAIVVGLDLPRGLLTAAALGTTAAVVLAGLALLRLAPLVRLDETGYRVRIVRGAGVRQGRWRDVEDVVTATLSGQRCLVLRLRNGDTTRIPVDVLDRGPDALVSDVHQHLDEAHRYRRLR